MLQRIALAAHGADGTPLTQALVPLTYTLTLSAADLAAWGGRLDRLQVRIWEADKGSWAEVPVEVDTANKRLTMHSQLLGDVAITSEQRYVFLSLVQQ